MTLLKKQTMIMLLVCCSGFSASADHNQVNQISNDIRLAQEQTYYAFQEAQDQRIKDRLKYSLDRLASAQDGLSRLQNNGPMPMPPPPYNPNPGYGGMSVELYKSDTCSSSLLGRISSQKDCSIMANENVWAIKINGVCKNIDDMSGAEVCQNFAAISNPRGVEIYVSDTCSSSLVAVIDSSTNCDSLSASRSAWAIKENGVCKNIEDMSLVQACKRFRP